MKLSEGISLIEACNTGWAPSLVKTSADTYFQTEVCNYLLDMRVKFTVTPEIIKNRICWTFDYEDTDLIHTDDYGYITLDAMFDRIAETFNSIMRGE